MRLAGIWAGVVLLGSAQAQSVAGMPVLHDPSTIIRDGNSYYVFSSGNGVPFYSSPDLQTWAYRGAVFAELPRVLVKNAPGNDGHDAWAPDIIKVGATFYLYYAVSKWGTSAAAIGVATNTTLDPANPVYKWVDRGMVMRSDGAEDMDDIDPGVIRASNGTMWLTYGSYKGTVDLVQLNPATGLKLKPHSLPYVLATESEASDIIEHDGWFYLFVNHGSCCKGVDSTYQINVGRSRKITGPYRTKTGKDLGAVPGEPFLATEGEHIGPGHFGRVIDETGVERFSVHYEADTGTKGKPVLAIRKLEWTADGWPKAGAFD